MKLIITKGLPASGKTTWAREWVTRQPKSRVRVNRDDIRKMLGPYWIPSREDLVTEIEEDMIISALNSNYNVVVDATNFRGIRRFEELVDPDNGYLHESICNKVQIVEKDFTDVPIETCIERDEKRTGDDYVGEEVIKRMYNKHLKSD